MWMRLCKQKLSTKTNTRCAMLAVRNCPNAVMGLCKFVAARWVKALKYNPSCSNSWACTEMHSKTVRKFTKCMPNLIRLLAGISSQSKPDRCFDFTDTSAVTGKLGVLQSLLFCTTHSVQDTWINVFQCAIEWFLHFPWLPCSPFKGRTVCKQIYENLRGWNTDRWTLKCPLCAEIRRDLSYWSGWWD